MDPLHAWALVLPGQAVFTHLTAAAALGWRMPLGIDQVPVFVDLPWTVPRPRRPGLRVTRVRDPVLVHQVRGLRLAEPAHVLAACARDLALLDLLVLLDGALHLGACSRAHVEAVADRRRGAPVLRRALALADARSQSPWETVLRLLHVVGGIPVVPQHEVRAADGRFVARGDLWLEGTSTLHEYDGAVHREPAQHARDLRRDRELLAAGWSRRGYVASDLVHRPDQVLRDAEATLGRRHHPAGVRRWRRLLAESSLTASGRDALHRRLAPKAQSDPDVPVGRSIVSPAPPRVRPPAGARRSVSTTGSSATGHLGESTRG